MESSGTAGDAIFDLADLPLPAVFDGLDEIMGSINFATVERSDTTSVIEIPVDVSGNTIKAGTALEPMLDGSADALVIRLDGVGGGGPLDHLTVSAPPSLAPETLDTIRSTIESADLSLGPDDLALALIGLESDLVPGVIMVTRTPEVVIQAFDDLASGGAPFTIDIRPDLHTNAPFRGPRLLVEAIGGMRVRPTDFSDQQIATGTHRGPAEPVDRLIAPGTPYHLDPPTIPIEPSPFDLGVATTTISVPRPRRRIPLIIASAAVVVTVGVGTTIVVTRDDGDGEQVDDSSLPPIELEDEEDIGDVIDLDDDIESETPEDEVIEKTDPSAEVVEDDPPTEEPVVLGPPDGSHPVRVRTGDATGISRWNIADSSRLGDNDEQIAVIIVESINGDGGSQVLVVVPSAPIFDDGTPSIGIELFQPDHDRQGCGNTAETALFITGDVGMVSLGAAGAAVCRQQLAGPETAIVFLYQVVGTELHDFSFQFDPAATPTDTTVDYSGGINFLRLPSGDLTLPEDISGNETQDLFSFLTGG